MPKRLGLVLFCATLLLPGAGAADCVILLHGLARTEHAMDSLAQCLEAAPVHS